MLVETSAANSLKSVTFPMYPDANGNITDYLQFQVSNFTFQVSTVAHYEYSPFGQVTFQSGELADSFAFRYSTKYWDSESGLGYWGYRYYDAEQGRWLGRDPIQEKGGKNLYVMCLNNVLCRIDALGMEDFQVIGDEIEPPEASQPLWERIQRTIGRTLESLFDSITHVDVFHGNTMIRQGYAGDVPKASPSNNLKNRKTWKLSVLKSGVITYGISVKTSCKCATHADIESCIRAAPAPRSDEYDAVRNNCQHDVENSISYCCLSGYKAVGFSPILWNYLSDDERKEVLDWMDKTANVDNPYTNF